MDVTGMAMYMFGNKFCEYYWHGYACLGMSLMDVTGMGMYVWV